MAHSDLSVNSQVLSLAVKAPTVQAQTRHAGWQLETNIPFQTDQKTGAS